MEFYLVLFACFLFLSASGLFGKSRPSQKPILVLIFIMAFFVAFRYNVGSDWGSYRNFYYTGIAEDKASGKTDIGFTLLRDICYHLGFSHAIFFYVISCLSLWAIYKTGKLLKVENMYIMFLIYISLFFCNFQFNIVRNGAMASFAWLAFAYRANGLYKRAWLWMIVASSFHIVGLIFFPFMLLIDMPWKKKYVFITLCVAFGLFMINFGENVVSLFPFLKLIDRIEGYVDTDRHDSYGLSIGMLFNIGLFMFTYFYYNQDYKERPGLQVALNAMLINIVICLTLNVFDTIVARIGQPMNMASLILWPFVFYKIKTPLYKIGLSCLFIVYLGLYYHKSWTNDDVDRRMLPYQIEMSQLFENK